MLHRHLEPGSIELALIDVSNELADLCDGKLAEMVVALIEAPSYRLAGAEEALRKLNRIAEEALRVQETLASELAERAAAQYKRIHDCILRCEQTMGKTSSSSGSMFFTRKSSAAATVGGELLDLLKSYPKTQFQALLLEHAESAPSALLDP